MEATMTLSPERIKKLAMHIGISYPAMHGWLESSVPSPKPQTNIIVVFGESKEFMGCHMVGYDLKEEPSQYAAVTLQGPKGSAAFLGGGRQS
jgi:hypothetical protein